MQLITRGRVTPQTVAFNSLFEMPDSHSANCVDGSWLSFNSLFEMRKSPLDLAREAGHDEAFNSLFEMPPPSSCQGSTPASTFNSLFEMHPPHHQPRVLDQVMLSILYLRCCFEKPCPPNSRPQPFNSLFEMLCLCPTADEG